MEREQALREEATCLLRTQELRAFGIWGFTHNERSDLCNAAIAAKPDSHNDVLAGIYLLALPNMDTAALGRLVRDLKRCGPRRNNA